MVHARDAHAFVYWQWDGEDLGARGMLSVWLEEVRGWEKSRMTHSLHAEIEA